MSLTDAIGHLKREMNAYGIHQENGLGNELFLFASTLSPVVNVDLLIFNNQGQVLLSWRDDIWCGTGWHIPGSCIRFDETFDSAIQRCAAAEIGTTVSHSDEPIKIYDIHFPKFRENLEDQRERKHFVALVFGCSCPEGYVINNHGLDEDETGYLRWFDELPANFLEIHECYRRDWKELKRRIRYELGK